MRRFLAAAIAALAGASSSGCSFVPFGGGGGYAPVECLNNQFTGDLADVKDGRSLTYATETGAGKTLQTVKVVGKDGGRWLIESWMDSSSAGWGFLFVVGADRKITKAWAAPKGGKEWKEIAVKEPPPASDLPGGPPAIKESDEKKDVKAGSFACRRLDLTTSVQGKDDTITRWFSKDVWRLHSGGPHGGLVASEGAGFKTWLEAKADDARPTLPLPRP